MICLGNYLVVGLETGYMEGASNLMFRAITIWIYVVLVLRMWKIPAIAL